jgi:hypothetical protein
LKNISDFLCNIFGTLTTTSKNTNEIFLMTKPNDKMTFFHLKSNNETVRDDLDHDIQLSENLSYKILANCIQGLVRLLGKHQGKKRLNAEQQQRKRTGKMKGASGMWSGRPGCWSRDPRRIRLIATSSPDHSVKAQLERADASACERMRAGASGCESSKIGAPFCNQGSD